MEIKHRQSASEYMLENPLWISIAPKHYSILVNPQAVQFCTKSSPFKSGCVFIDESSRGVVKLVSLPHNSVYCLKLWRFNLLSGYASLALISENKKRSEKIAPSCCLSLANSRENYSIIFLSADICQLWTESALKLRKNVKAKIANRAREKDKNIDITLIQDKLGCIYDISYDSYMNKHWAEITATFVDADSSTSEHFIYDLRNKNVKSCLKETTATFKGSIDSMSFAVLQAFVSDLIVLKQTDDLFQVPPFYEIKREDLKKINTEIAYRNEYNRKAIESACKELMKVSSKHAVNDMFSVLKAQKMAIVYSSFKICKKFIHEPFSRSVRRSLEAEFEAQAKKCDEDQIFFAANELLIPEEGNSPCNPVRSMRTVKSKSMIHKRLIRDHSSRDLNPLCTLF